MLENERKDDIWYEEHSWENQILTRYHDDYFVDIFLIDGLYKTKVYLEDLCGVTEMVDCKDFTSLEEAKNYSINRMNRKI